MKVIISIFIYILSLFMMIFGAILDPAIIGVMLACIGIALNLISIANYDKWKDDELHPIVEFFSTGILGEIASWVSFLLILGLLIATSIVLKITGLFTILVTILYIHLNPKAKRTKDVIDIEQLAIDVQDIINSKFEFIPHEIAQKYHKDKEIIKGKEVVFKHVDRGDFSHALRHIKHMIEATEIALPDDVEEEYRYYLEKFC